MDLSIVLVHYHTPALVVQAVGALRADLSRSNLEAQMILVDNGSEPEDRRRLQELGLEWIDAGGNTGYAGGVNRGVAASKAPYVVVMNPDVLVRSGCLTALLAALEDGAAAAGPRFFWDRDERFLLPPAEPRTRRWELTAACAPYTGKRVRVAREAWRRHARQAWLAEAAFESYDLSGALLALRQDAFEKVGPFDEEYRLYFEETDWLHRLRRLSSSIGLSALHVPAARAVHLYNRSAAAEPQSAAWFAQSQARFRRRHYGRLFARLVEVIERRAPPPSTAGDVGAVQIGSRGEVDLPPIEAPAWVELSPSPLGFPAAAERLTEPVEAWRLPPELIDQVRGYWLRVPPVHGRFPS